MEDVLVCYFKKIKLPVAEYIAKNGFYLPSGNTIANEEIDFVCDQIKEIVN